MEQFGFFSERLAISMAESNLTAKALAPRVRCSYRSIRKLLKGQSLPAAPLLLRLCDTFKWDEKQLHEYVEIDRGRKKFGNGFWIFLGKNPRCDALYILWEFLTPEERDFFANELRSLVEKKRKRNGGKLGLS